MPRPTTSPRPRATMARATRLAAALSVATAAIFLAACSSNTIDQGSLESGVEDLAPNGVNVESASCPDDVSSDEGTDFECTVATSDGDIKLGATVTSEGDEDVQFEITTVNGNPVKGG